MDPLRNIPGNRANSWVDACSLLAPDGTAAESAAEAAPGVLAAEVLDCSKDSARRADAEVVEVAVGATTSGCEVFVFGSFVAGSVPLRCGGALVARVDTVR
jgi:hypothetical protein